MLRKVAVAAASKPHVEIRQDGDQFYIKTSTTVRTTEINFKVGEGFEEETVDGRKCRVSPPPGQPWAPERERESPPAPSLPVPSLSRLPGRSLPRAALLAGLLQRFAGTRARAARGRRRWQSRHVSCRRWIGSSRAPPPSRVPGLLGRRWVPSFSRREGPHASPASPARLQPGPFQARQNPSKKARQRFPAAKWTRCPR